MGEIQSSFSHFLWKSSTPTKVKIFFRLLPKGSSRHENSLRKGWDGDPGCPFCQIELEIDSHISSTVPMLRMSEPIFCLVFPRYSGLQILKIFLYSNSDSVLDHKLRSLWKVVFPVYCWCMWRSRNNLIFNKEKTTPKCIASNIARFVLFWTICSGRKEAVIINGTAKEHGLGSWRVQMIKS
ncbi:uncharacterized protein LOC109832458 [Asparagus officinalis]|uniref:uncharacterized protein LOC109832458 n=1 Tax=Asparagus officinalis TaxID=4686 RepID=UPI00098E4FDB|nr:uncharacterized protein LOC109832458 [Asparagus officinalis]